MGKNSSSIKRKIIVLSIAILLSIAIACTIWYILFMQSWGNMKTSEINEVKYVTAPNGSIFRIEYEYPLLFTSEYYAYIYTEDNGECIVRLMLPELENGEMGRVNPDPNLMEVYSDDSLICYTFWDRYLLFWHNDARGYARLDRNLNESTSNYSNNFYAVANILANSNSTDPRVRAICRDFLD